MINIRSQLYQGRTGDDLAELGIGRSALFDAMSSLVVRLLEGDFGTIWLFAADRDVLVGAHNLPDPVIDYVLTTGLSLRPRTADVELLQVDTKAMAKHPLVNGTGGKMVSAVLVPIVFEQTIVGAAAIGFDIGKHSFDEREPELLALWHTIFVDALDRQADLTAMLTDLSKAILS